MMSYGGFEILHLIGAYFVGSIPTGYLITRIIAGIDVRRHGSGNIGATNVSRVLGKKFFFLILFLDACKAFLFLNYIQHSSSGEQLFVSCAALLLIGNCYSIFLRGDGGKGGATLFGVACASSSFLGLYFFIIWSIGYLISKIPAVATLAAACSLPLVAWCFDLHPFLFLCAFILVCVRHKDNICQLYNN